MAAVNPILKKEYGLLARKMESILKYQAPKDTGFLGSQVSVTYEIGSDGRSVKFVTDLGGARYGIFLNQGSGSERDPNPGRGKWDPNPGRGKGGIKPSYWMNFSDTQNDVFIDEIIQAQLLTEVEIIAEEFSDFSDLELEL